MAHPRLGDFQEGVSFRDSGRKKVGQRANGKNRTVIINMMLQSTIGEASVLTLSWEECPEPTMCASGYGP